MLYIDTSIIVKLYFKEEHSLKVSNWIKTNNEAIPLTSLHELEFTNAVHLKRFRDEITEDEIGLIFSRFADHNKKGVFYRPPIDWPDIYQYALDLSKRHTGKIGSSSLDILHVASALSIKADRFLTLDVRQVKLASLAGLKIEDCIN